MSGAATRIVILGGGFAGVYTARYLARSLTAAERGRVEITLVSKENYVVFQPLLPEVISGSVDMLHVISPIRRLAKGVRIVTREVEAIDLERRTVRVAPGHRPMPLVLEYDQLVLALGNRLDGSRIPGVPEHALVFKYLGDALRLRNHLVHLLEEAEIETDAAERRKLLTFVVAGGGFSGVECIAEMQDFLRDALKAYPRLDAREIRLVLLQRGERILPELTEPLGLFAQDVLRKRGIDIRLQTGLKSMSAGSVTFEHKETKAVETIETATCVATVPAGPHPVLASLPIAEKGRIPVDEFLATKRPGVWALGDCATVTLADGSVSPPTAQHALRQAKTCALNLAAAVRGGPRTPFAFAGLGTIGSLGRRNAVAEVFGVRIKGLPAWLLWRGVYASKFPGFDRQVRLLFDWILDAFLPRDITQLRVFHPESVEREHFQPGETVFAAGDHGDKVYFVVKGELEAVRDGARLATLRDGDVFGEAALLSNAPRNATIRAVTAADAVTVSREAFEAILRHVPGVEPEMKRIFAARAIGAVPPGTTA
jgi:NADH dehydrogenase